MQKPSTLSVTGKALDHDTMDSLFLKEFMDDFSNRDRHKTPSPKLWNEIERENFKADEKNQYDYSFVTLEKKNVSR